MIYSFWLYDRHCECIYVRKWHESTNQYSISAQDDAKLIFGVVFSLRNMVRRLRIDDQFLSFKTSAYKLHYYETPTNLKFVFLSDPHIESLRLALHQIYVSLYVEYVVKNPLSPIEHPGGEGVGVELFNPALDGFVRSLDAFK